MSNGNPCTLFVENAEILFFLLLHLTFTRTRDKIYKIKLTVQNKGGYEYEGYTEERFRLFRRTVPKR